ncbi:lysosomal phospholipase A and acyltransferase-like [Hydra vulgaris]|uniref:Lysosomal phospholipase A and acyltransferase-like n=1 Tax=Hydra vulgaris TaxID=6087 RepID=A0ABM4DNU4_HYDVU
MDIKSLIFKIFHLFVYFGNSSTLTPIVIVPGIGGSQIEAKLDRNESLHNWCYKKYPDWFTIWLSVEELIPLVEPCWADNIKLNYNDDSKRMENSKGVYTRVPDFGNTSAIEWLDPSFHIPGMYFYPFVDNLARLAGYERGKTLRAAPYDFRYDPNSAGDYFENLRLLIEKTYFENGNNAVMLISHSMGAPYSLHFLQKQTQSWKDKFIMAWTTISGVFGGSVKAVLAYINGDGFGVPHILDNPTTFRAFQRTFPSLAYILPDSRFWHDQEAIVKTNNQSYSVNDYDELFQDINFPLARTIKKLVPLAWSAEPPGVKMFCFYGNLVETPEMLYYKTGFFPDNLPLIHFGDGDGTVNLRSLEGCKMWKGKQNQQIIHRMFSTAEHNRILGDSRLIHSVIDALEEKL